MNRPKHHVDVPLKVLDSLCTDMILGIDFLSKHKSLHINFGGEGSEIKVNNKSKFCNLTAVKREPPRLFQNLDPEVKPIKAPGRKYSHEDKLFISTTVSKLLEEGVVVPSSSPWRAQVIVAKDNESNKKRLCIDYSQTINRFTHQDAYPLANIHDQATAISQYKLFSHLDL